MVKEFVNATSIDDVLSLLERHRGHARIVAGATDLILEIERGLRPGIDVLIDVTRIAGIREIRESAGRIVLGPLVTHNDVVASPLLQRAAPPLVQAAWEVGSPQIRNRGTIAGNLITASPANDTITPLIALDASIRLRSRRGERVVALSSFYTGVRRTVMETDEMLVGIEFAALKGGSPGSNLRDGSRGAFVKIALRRAQAISVCDAAVVVKAAAGVVEDVRIALGSVAPTIVRAAEAERSMTSGALDTETIERAAALAAETARPIDDVRSTSTYRKEMVRVAVRRCLNAVLTGEAATVVPAEPVLLGGSGEDAVASDALLAGRRAMRASTANQPVTALNIRVNGEHRTVTTGLQKTLLRLLRENVGLTGTKEGCAEGECGACTVYLDGSAVMSCLVPACRADGADIVTVEGLAHDGELHPVQEGFLREGAVQCGYCTPGFLMAAGKLLEEKPEPTDDEMRHAITGNLCRCTGYYKILKAMRTATEVARLPHAAGRKEA